VAASEVAATTRLLLLVLAATGAGCDRTYEGGGDLRAQRVVLEREVEGLRTLVQRLERGEALLPPDDIAVAIEDGFVRDLIVAQLPFDADIDRFHVQLTDADVQFRGSPMVQLRGQLQVRDQPDVTAAVTLFGALKDIRIDRTSDTLQAAVAADHLTIEQATGPAQYLSGAVVDEAARRIRLAIGEQLPEIRIPVKVQQQIAFPAVSEGPVTIRAARMPLDVAVSQVVAVRGRLWVSLHVTPGPFDAPGAAKAAP
jgi:hypothetical protein